MHREDAQASTCPSAAAHTPSLHAIAHFRPSGIAESARARDQWSPPLSASLPGGPLQPSAVHATPEWPPRGTRTHTDTRTTLALTRQGVEGRATGPEDPLSHRECSKGVARVRGQQDTQAQCSRTGHCGRLPTEQPRAQKGPQCGGQTSPGPEGRGGSSRGHSGQGLDRGPSGAKAGASAGRAQGSGSPWEARRDHTDPPRARRALTSFSCCRRTGRGRAFRPPWSACARRPSARPAAAPGW